MKPSVVAFCARMRRALTILLLVLAAREASADRADWTGSAVCATCHPTVAAAWKLTAHARAADHLGAQPKARCLACHGTGDAPAGKAIETDVGCEACHGSGHDYAEDDLMRDLPLAQALGLRSLDTGTTACAGCHRGAGTRLFEPSLDITGTSVH
jgi:hypothetical protein